MNDTRRALLRALADGPVTGPQLASDLGVSRAAVWKQVEGLREEGFEVVGGDDGYAVASVPEYGGAAVEFGLDAPFAVEFHDSLPSTNDRARELAAEGREDVVVVADEQTGGRGRLSREWNSPSGGVWASVLTRPRLPPAHAPLYTLAAAVAVTRAARGVGVDASIKWPNDVMVDDAKLAGVLTEMEGEADRISWLIVGVGVNANVDPDSLPAGATSLRAEVGDVTRSEFLQRALTAFDTLTADPDAILDAWREHAATLGRRVRVETPTGVVEGRAVGVRFPGALVVETEDAGGEYDGHAGRSGGEVTIHAGDCEHLRPV
ncbi:MAG: biotin--[acetyl-CoA-carboxylase] ligase [Haloferacaceae archaeon]